MIPVHEAEHIIAATIKDYGTETVHFEKAGGRILAEGILCDRDFPPYNRVSMDGIAIRYAGFESGLRSFYIKGTQAAGDDPIAINNDDECIEIMTGAALPDTADTIIRYEDLIIGNGKATLLVNTLKKGQSIHYKGVDKKQGDIAAPANVIIDHAVISIAATIGTTDLLVRKLPRIAILSTGDELVDIHETPTPYQVRRSNGYTIKEILKRFGIDASITHLPDNPGVIEEQLRTSLDNYDVLLLSGGVSMGKYDHLPSVFEKLAITQLFHKVQQRPGKPLWFGKHGGGAIVFAFPGNPVSAFLCMHRYFIPWLEGCLGLQYIQPPHAILGEDVTFAPSLQYFMQVKATVNEQGKLIAMPMHGNGSGDLANLVETNAFLELPAERDHFMKGEVFRLWPFKNIFS
jgi:molybdopterin molybdotransferase